MRALNCVVAKPKSSLQQSTNKQAQGPSISAQAATSSEADTRIGAATTISRPSSVGYRRSTSWSAALSDGPRTPTSSSDQHHAPALVAAASSLEGLAIIVDGSRQTEDFEGPWHGHPSQIRSWPSSEDNSHTRPHFRSDASRRWSADVFSQPDAVQKTSPESDRERRTGRMQDVQSTVPIKANIQRRLSSEQTPYRSRSVGRIDPIATRSLSPSTGFWKSPVSPASPQARTPSILATGDWGFLHAFLHNSSDNSPALAGSPRSGHRPGSGRLSRDYTIRSPSAFSQAWETNASDVNNDEHQASRSHTPATVRASSSALEPIMERASMDQNDTSLGDTSVFMFDRYRFSTVSARSEPTETSPRSSPVPATHSGDVTARTSRASSRYSDISSQGVTAGFRPKQLLLTGASRSADPRRGSSRLSRSFSVPLLTLETAQSDKSSASVRNDRARSETAGSPSSARAYLTPTPTFEARFLASPTLSESPKYVSTRLGDEETGEGSADVAQDVVGLQQCERESLRTTDGDRGGQRRATQTKSVPAKISISQPSGRIAVAIQEDGPSTSFETSRPLPVFGTSSQRSPNELTTGSTTRDRHTSSETDADQSLRSDSLSPPRSAASAETRSSETIEVVPWQVATTDPTSPRRSEEIFRPLSTALSMSRGGPGSSRDTIISGSMLPVAVAPSGSHRSSLQMPQTPLKGGTDFIWGRPDAERGRNEGRIGPIDPTVAAHPKPFGLGMSVPVPSIGLETSTAQYPTDETKQNVWRHTGERDATRRKVGHEKRLTEYRISSPPGAMRRLLLELDHTSKDGSHSEAVSSSSAPVIKTEHESGPMPVSTHHGRSATLNNITVLPRTSSMRRRHQSVDEDRGHRGDLAINLSNATAIEAVAEDRADPNIESRPINRAARSGRSGPGTDARGIGDDDKDASAPGRALVDFGKLVVKSTPLRISLEAFLLVYQALFFTFEAAYLWKAISPAVPLVASGLFLVLDVLILETHLLKSVRNKFFLGSTIVTIPTMAFCSAMCALKIILLTGSADLGASAPGIHLNSNRSDSDSDSAFALVLRDNPFSGILFILGLISMLLSAVLVGSMSLHLLAAPLHH